MPKPIVVIPFASQLHGKEYYLSVLELMKRYLNRYTIEIHGDVITREDEISAVAKQYSNYLPVALVLTGGTSRLVRRFVEVGAFERIVILAHGEHNSLPSAISIRAKLESDGIWTWLYSCYTPHDDMCQVVIDRMMKSLMAVSEILNSKIGIVGVESKSEAMENFEVRFGSEIVLIPMEEFEERIEAVDSEDIKDFKLKLEGVRFELPTEKLDHVARIYVALKRLFTEYKFDALAIDCFPYLIKHGVTPCLALALLNAEGYITACEADIQAVFGMMVSKSISGFSGWIANASAFQGRRGIFAHCTIALNMVRNPVAVSHLESGYPYALTGELSSNTVTLLSVSPDFSLMVTALGRIVSSGMLSEAMCRTQALIEFDFDAEKIPLAAPANHHIIIPDDHREELKSIAYLLGMDYAEYPELMI